MQSIYAPTTSARPRDVLCARMTHGQVPSSTPGHLKTNDGDDDDISLRERNECCNRPTTVRARARAGGNSAAPPAREFN